MLYPDSRQRPVNTEAPCAELCVGPLLSNSQITKSAHCQLWLSSKTISTFSEVQTCRKYFCLKIVAPLAYSTHDRSAFVFTPKNTCMLKGYSDIAMNFPTVPMKCYLVSGRHLM